MLILTTPTIDEGDTSCGTVKVIGHVFAESGFRIPHNNHVKITTENSNRILLTLTFVF